MSRTKVRQYASVGMFVAGGVVVGAVLAGTLTASATDTPTPTSTAGTQGEASANPGDPSRPQRSDETLLTGTTAAKVKAAVRAEYPGATFVRVETDSDGVYEAHITKADGTEIAVEVDKGFAVTGVEEGGHGGHHGGRDGDPDGDDTSGSTT